MDRQLRILLVDDDEDEYVLLKNIFARLPGQESGRRYMLDWAPTYEAGLAVCSQRDHDVYLVDYHLGLHNGLDLMRAAFNQGCSGPFILLTGQGSYELDLAAMEQGVYDYLLKDQLTENLLERSIRYALARRHDEEVLETRVQERTQALAEANDELKTEMDRRARAEETVRESEARFRALAETTSAAIFIVQDGIIRYANPATRFVTGYAPEEVLGRELWRLVHPDYQRHFQSDRLVNQWAQNVPARYEMKIITKRGEERWMDVTAGSMLFEGRQAWLFTAFDITERDRAEQALRQSEASLLRAKEGLEQRVIERTAQIQATSQRLETVLRTLPAAILIADEAGRIIESNDAFEVLWESSGPPPQDLMDWEHFEAFNAQTGDRIGVYDWPLARAVLHGESILDAMFDIRSLTGKKKTILTSAVPIIDDDGVVLGGVSVSQDITQQRLLEQQAQAAARDAQQRAEELDGLARATAALLSTLELDELLCQILDAAQSAIPAAEKGLLHLASKDSGLMQVRATLGFSDKRIRLVSAPKDTGVPAQVVRERQPLIINNIQAQGLSVEALYGNPNDFSQEIQELSSLIMAPLQIGDRVLGALSLISTRPNAFTASNLHLLSSFAATTTAALQNALLHAEIKQLAVTDPLTGLYNRRAFFDIGQREIERFQRFNHPLSAIMFDLDNFKQINDTYGHGTGDQILRSLSERVSQTIRETDVFGRYGGDEFALLLPDTDLFSAEHIAGRVREAALADPWVTEQGIVPVSISVGVAQVQKSHRTLETLLADADQALYKAKTGGRNRVEVVRASV